ncbi:NAD-dependent epimerase/dehydratase family protein [Candidatus Margulisiibacteriota bacterium]
MPKIKDVIAEQSKSIKEVMRLIDSAGIRLAYVVDKNKRLVGVVSDSDIRRAILKGRDIKEAVAKIINPRPVVLREKDLLNSYLVRKTVSKLLKKMPDSRYIVLLDKKDCPKKLLLCSDLIGSFSCERKKVHRGGKHVLVVGGAGYLGSVLVRKLLLCGYRVRVLDLLLFGGEAVEDLLTNEKFELIKGDMRHIPTIVRALDEIDAVINLAAVVGDPACKNMPEAAIETNFLANKVLAEACKYNQINRFIYASTCSVYGAMENDEIELEETAPLNPVSLYARSKIAAEEGILNLEDENFSPTILRMSTLYGFSPRMRFDLVVNAMTKTATVNGRIDVHGGGRQWRPLLHVGDAAEAYIKCLEAPIDGIRGKVFNVGSNEQNYQILKIAQTVKKHIPQAALVVEGESGDPRNYFVSFAKIKQALKYRVGNGLDKSIIRIKRAIDEGEIKNANDPKYYNVEYNQ